MKLHLAASVRLAKHVLLAEVAVRGEDDDAEHIGGARQELRERHGVGRLEQVEGQVHGVHGPPHRAAPPGFEPQLLQVFLHL